MIIQTQDGNKLELPDGTPLAGIDDAISHFKSTQQPQGTTVSGLAKSFGTGIEQAPDWLGDTSNSIERGVTRLGGAAKEGLADVGIGEHLTPEQAEKLTNPPLPFYGSSEALKKIGAPVYEPKTGLETGANILGNIASGAAISKIPEILGAASKNAALTAAESPPSGGDGGGPPTWPKTPAYDPVATHSAISDSYGAAKETAGKYYDFMRNLAAGKQADATGIKSGLNSIIDDVQSSPFHEASSQVPYLKAQAAKIGDSDTMPLNDLVSLKQNLNANFNPKRFSQGADTPYQTLGNSVDASLKDAAKKYDDFGDAKALADKNWLNTVESPFQNNPVLKRFWQPEDYYAKKSVDNGMLEELPDATKQRAETMVSKIQSPTQLNAIRRVLPQDMADQLSQAKIQQITQGEGTGRLSAAGQVLTKGLDLTPSGIANTGRNISNVISPRYTPEQQALLQAAKTSSPTLSGKYSGPFKNMKALQQQETDSASEMQPMNYAPKDNPINSYFPNAPEINPNASMVSSLSPQERLAAQSNVLQSAANRNIPATDARKLNALQQRMAAQTSSPSAAPIKSLQDIASPKLSESLAREHYNNIQSEIQQLRSMGMSEQEISARYPGFKRGGSVNTNPSEAQIKIGGKYLVKLPRGNAKERATFKGYIDGRVPRVRIVLEDGRKLSPIASKTRFYQMEN